jgi:hypothetical protein
MAHSVACIDCEANGECCEHCCRTDDEVCFQVGDRVTANVHPHFLGVYGTIVEKISNSTMPWTLAVVFSNYPDKFWMKPGELKHV